MSTIINILSFDPGPAHTGYATIIVDTDERVVHLTPMYGVLKSPKELSDTDRVDMIGDGAGRLFDTFKPDYIGIEGWSYMGSRGKQESQLPALVEHLRMRAKHYGAIPKVYDNAAWKKYLMNCAGANKDQIKHYVGRRLSKSGINAAHLAKIPQHVWDALGICFCVTKEIAKI